MVLDMDVLDIINKRKSIRKYKNQSIPPKYLDKIIDSARKCQSAKNRQPWKLMIIEKQDKDMIAKIMLDTFLNAPSLEKKYMASSVMSSKVIKNAPIAIGIFRDNEEIQWEKEDLLSIGAAIENMCLEATSLGLGSVWIRDVYYSEKEIVKQLSVNNFQLISILVIGIPDNESPCTSRKEMKEIIFGDYMSN